MGSGLLEGTQACPRQEAEELGHADFRRKRDRGDVLRTGKRDAREHWTPIAAIVVARRVDDAVLRGREVGGNVGQHACRRKSFFEAQRVSERLEGGARLAMRQWSVDGPAVGRVGVISGSFPRQPLAGAIVEHHHGHIARAVTPKGCAMAFDDTGDIRLEPRIERCLDPIGPGGPDIRQDHLDEMRRREGRAVWRHVESLGASLGRLLGRDRAGRFHASKDDPLSRYGGVPVPIRIETRWTLRQPGEECRLCGRQHRRWNAEVGAARALDAGDLIAITGEVHIHRQDLALGEAMFQPDGDHGFVNLGPPPARA